MYVLYILNITIVQQYEHNMAEWECYRWFEENYHVDNFMLARKHGYREDIG